MRSSICQLRHRAVQTWDGFIWWAVRRLPRILLTDTWQTMIAVLMISVGIATLYVMFTGESTVTARTLSSTVLRLLWGASFVAGGLCQLAGLQLSHRRTERLGMHLCGLAATVLSLTLFSLHTAVATMYGLAFGFLALGNFIRLFISTAARIGRRT